MSADRQGPTTRGTTGKSAAAAGRRQPKKITAQRLERVALAYLQKYAAPAAGVRRVLHRRINKAARVHETDVAVAHEWVEDVISRLIRSGLVDDAAYADGRVRSLCRQGRSRRYITGYLHAKGVDRDLIGAAIAALPAEDTELRAAMRFAKRRRLGPFAMPERADRDRSLAALGRAGFSYDVARRVAEAHSIGDLEDDVSAGDE